MRSYITIVIIVNFLVNFFLLSGIKRMAGSSPGWGRTATAAAVSGLHCGACLLPGFHFLGSLLWRCVSLVIVSGIAFGLYASALQKGVLFTIFSLALSGCVGILGSNNMWRVLLGGIVILTLCFLGFRGDNGFSRYVPVELRYGDQKLALTALRDTGNMLRDPVSGQSVLVIGPDAANQLVGLTREQLRRPVEALEQTKMSGLRLIPYHSIGQPGGLLLALRFPEVRIGNWKGSTLVAFAPERLGSEEKYQALTGGMV